MRVTKVMVHLEMPCVRCGNPASQMGLAAVTEDGRIGEPLEPCDPKRVCQACQDQERAAEKQECKAAQERQAWANGKVKKTRLRGA